MAFLTGEFSHKVDEKGRVSFPASFRKVLPSELKMLRSLTDNCLMVFSTENYEAWINEMFEKKGGFNPSSKSHIKMMRTLTARTIDVEIDKAGRIGIKAELRAQLGIEDVAVLVGTMDHVEIWSASAWDELNNADDAEDFSDFFVD